MCENEPVSDMKYSSSSTGVLDMVLNWGQGVCGYVYMNYNTFFVPTVEANHSPNPARVQVLLTPSKGFRQC